VHVPAELALIEVDGLLLERALVNLLDNACKHTPAGTTVELGARLAGDEVIIEVADDGPGLPAADPSALFAAFRRGQSESSTPGMGLGLALVERIAQLHGGSILARQRAPHGAVFELRLPRGSAPPTGRCMNLRAARILLVEDDAQIRHFVRLALKDAGYEVMTAGKARRGSIDAATRRPDLVIVDLGLPDGDGKHLIVQLRAWSDSPVLVLSTCDQEGEKVAALDAGADDYLTKPFGVDELLARLRALLRRRAALACAADAVVRIGDIEIDCARHAVCKRGEPIHLTPIEYRLLTALLRARGAVMTYRELLQAVWGPGCAERTHVLRVHMANLRQKLEDDPTRPIYLLTELQVGYRLAGL